VTATREFRFGLRGALAIAVLAAAFVLPTQAFAGGCSHAGSDPTAAQYCPQEVPVNENTSKPTTNVPDRSAGETTVSAPESTSSSGSLPFTGFDVGALVAVAIALTGTGLLLRRIANPGGPKA
jgi:hypothetical protein